MTDSRVSQRVAAWVWAVPPKPGELVRYVRSATVASLGVWVVVAAGAALRWHGIDAEGLWLDEVASYEFATQRYDTSIELVTTAPVTDPHPPLYYLLLRWWTGVFGTSEVGMRSMSFVFGVVTILLTYLLVMKLFERRLTALVASALVAVSTMHVYFAQEARMYTLMTMLTAASFYWYVDIVFADAPSRSGLSRYVLATVLLGYTHTFGAFLILAQNVHAVLQARRNTGIRLRDPVALVRGSPLLRRWIGTQVVVGALLSPWVVLLTAHAFGIPIVDLGDTGWIPKSSLFYLFDTLHVYLFYNVGGDDYLVYGHGWLVWVTIGLAVGALLGFNPDADPDDDRDEIEFEAADRSLMLATWLAIPLVVPYAITYFFDPIYRQKYAIGASIAFFVMAAYGLTKLRDNYGRTVPAALAVLLVAGTVAPLGAGAIYDDRQKPDWRTAVDGLEDRADGDALVVTSPTFMDNVVEYYADDDVTVASVPPNATWNGTLSEAVDGHDRVWFAYATWYLSGDRARYLFRQFVAGGYDAPQYVFERVYSYEWTERGVATYSVFAVELSRDGSTVATAERGVQVSSTSSMS